MAIESFFPILWMSLIMNENLTSLKSIFFAKSFSAFVILAKWCYARCNYLI